MSAVDEHIVREYFEQNGFLVRQVRKYAVPVRKRTSDEDRIDMLVLNPAYEAAGRKPGFCLAAGDLPLVHRAILSVKGWHTGLFNPATLRGNPAIFEFLDESVQREANRMLPFGATTTGTGGDLLKLLVIPGLPPQEPFRGQSIAMLRERGVDGVILFRTVLLELISRVEVNRSYNHSDALQIIRLLKNYDLLGTQQLDLFPEPGARRRGRKGG
jgi:hypothetical protein